MRLMGVILGWILLASAHAESNFTFSNGPGPFSVGFKVVAQYDRSRTYRGTYDVVTGEKTEGESARPIQTLIWYPAGKAGKPMVYGDYLLLGGSEDRFDRDPPEVARVAAAALSEYVAFGTDEARLSREKAEPVWATRDAVPEPGKFPILIYAASDSSSAFENAQLCEYLASHGYLVIASPSLGAHSRYMTDEQDADDLESTQAQAQDIGFLIGYAHSLPQADTAHIAVVGYSWGGMAGTFAAARDSRIGALVDLDGSIRYFPKLVQAAKYITPERVAVPLMFFADQEDPIEAGRDALPKSFINQMRYADVFKVGMHALSHEDLSDENLRLGSAADHRRFSATEINLGYSWMARYTLAFLDACLKDDAAATVFLSATPAQNRVPTGVLSMHFDPRSARPPTLERFAGMLAQQHFADATAAYNRFRHANPGFLLPESVFGPWASSLFGEGKTREAIELDRLRVSLHPDSAAACMQLAIAFEANGDRPQAIRNYERALRLDRNNTVAAARIKALQTPP